MIRIVTRTWMVWALLVAVGCGEKTSMDNMPWLTLDPSQRQQRHTDYPNNTKPPSGESNHPGGFGVVSSGLHNNDEITNASNPRPWRYIVIHHSAQESGNASTIDAAHRARGWDGLGYHFVIDNGNGGTDGKVEVGSRWKQQKWGAHTGNTPDNEYNNFGIGISLVGDFTNHLPSQAQLAAMDRLVQSLMTKYNISPQNVIGHREAPGAKTECPGDAFYNYIRNTYRPGLVRQFARK
jgi:hypothetical protein